MTRTKLILAGLLAGAMALGTACKSDKAAERGEPTESTQGADTTDTGGTNPEGTGGSGYEEDDSAFQGNQQFGGDSFPSDNERVNRAQNRD
jgi:hypothetical protein